MRIFISGATGVLGRRLVEQFARRGHSVAGLVRDPRGEQRVKSLGGEPRWADLFNPATLARAAEGCDIILHAATSIPVKPKISTQDWMMNDRIRREGTRALADAAARVGAKLYLQQSVVWVARPRDESPFREDSPVVCEDPILQSAADAESIAREAGEKHGFCVAVLRGGSFYDAESGHTRMLAEGLRHRKLPIMGSGDAVWAMIHTDDMAAAFVAAAEKPQSGIWHVVDNELVTVRDFFLTFAMKLGAPAPRRVPLWLARWVTGEATVRFFNASTRTTNAHLRHDFAWAPQYPTYREGLDQILAAWKSNSPSKAE
ncbi:MAG TPA: NAD(P)-dependent oxidoreductase [Candidatus Acidoferrales bacterium]|nr:NAD(P)-dependent oxidoreductase [Candidatus Acidoferrales bacterium]